MNHLKKFWYVIAESHELTKHKVLGRQVCDEWLVCFRDKAGNPTVLRDRCLHRCGRLSTGNVINGQLQCPYHGWIYDGQGKVVKIPAMDEVKNANLQAPKYPAMEQDGYIYVCLVNNATETLPFAMQYYQKPGWKSVRLQNVFQNNLTNCVENFIDIPHTAFVHKGIFRSSRNEKIVAQVVRKNGQVHVTYQNEKQNLGSFNWFLNPNRQAITHTDSFFMPNITLVSYALKDKWQYVITSQSVPVSVDQTRVYTEISYRFGWLTPFLAGLIRRQAQKVIDQDIQVLNQQMAVIKKYGTHFYDTPADKIHAYVTEIIQALQDNQDAIELTDQAHEVTFLV